MAICTNCGKEVSDSIKFCTACGNAMNQNSATQSVIPKTQIGRPQTQMGTPHTQMGPSVNTSYKPKKTISNRSILIAIIAVLTAVAVGIGGFFIWKANDDDMFAASHQKYSEEKDDKDDKDENDEENDGDNNNSDKDSDDENTPVADDNQYSDAKGAGTYYITDGDEYVLNLGETIKFEITLEQIADIFGITETELSEGVYSIVWTFSGHLKQSGGFGFNGPELSTSGTAQLPGEGNIYVVIGYMDESYSYTDYSMESKITVLGDGSSSGDDNYDYNYDYDYDYDYDYNYNNNTPSYNCIYCNNTGMITCNTCYGSGQISYSAPNYSGEYKPPTYSTCTSCGGSGKTACPLC